MTIVLVAVTALLLAAAFWTIAFWLKPTSTPLVSNENQEDKKPATVALRQTQPYRADTREFTLLPGKGIEVMTRLPEGGALVYSWRSLNGANLYQEFHGVPAKRGRVHQELETYFKNVEATESRGVLIAPFAGKHGWYLRNRGNAAVPVVLQLSGFYSEITSQ